MRTKRIGSLFFAPHGQLGQSYYKNFYQAKDKFWYNFSGFGCVAGDDKMISITKNGILREIVRYISAKGYKESKSDGFSDNLKKWFFSNTGYKSISEFKESKLYADLYKEYEKTLYHSYDDEY